MDENDRKALSNIEEFGCHVLKVMEGEGEPCFCYSIGINKKQNKPDLLITGLDLSLAHSIVNNYKDRLLAGESFDTENYYSDFLEGFDVCFVKVDKKHYEEYLGFGLWLHGGNDFEVLQMIWPTTGGKWPWDIDTSDYYKWAQPVLNASGVLSKI